MGCMVGRTSEKIFEFESGSTFGLTFGLTFGMTLCVDCWVDFAGDLRAEFELDQAHLAPTYVTLLDRELSRI